MSELPAEQKILLAKKVFWRPEQVLDIEAGTELLRRGEINSRLYFVATGHFDMLEYDADAAEELPVLRVGPGELVGVQSAYLHNYVSTNTVVAIERSSVAYVDLREENDPDIEKN